MQNKQPQISVIIITFNNRNQIEDCIDSVTQQTFSNIEILCIDGGSTDGTVDFLKEYGKKDSRLKVFLSYKRSYGGLLNHGLSIANGKYVTFLDAKDTLEEYALSKLNSLTQKNYIDILQGSVSPTNNKKEVYKKDVLIEKAFTINREPLFLDYGLILGTIFKRSFLIHKNILFLEEDDPDIINYFFYESAIKSDTIVYTDNLCGFVTKNTDRRDKIDALKSSINRINDIYEINKEFNSDDNSVNNKISELIFDKIKSVENNECTTQLDYDTCKTINGMFKKLDKTYVKENFSDIDKKLFFKFRSPLLLYCLEQENTEIIDV